MRLLNNRIDMANGNGYLVDENGNKFYPVACKLYMKENGYGDKFAVVPEFNGGDDGNKLRIQGAVGGAGTDPALYDLMTISGKSGTIWTKGHIVNSSCRVNTVVGSWVRLFTMKLSARWKSYGVWFSLSDCQNTNENALVNIYIHKAKDNSWVHNFQCLDLQGGDIQSRLKVVKIDLNTFGVYFKMNGSDSPSFSIIGTNSLVSNDGAFGEVLPDCNTVVETLPSGTQCDVVDRLQRNIICVGLTGRATVSSKVAWTQYQLPLDKVLCKNGSYLSFANNGVTIGSGISKVAVEAQICQWEHTATGSAEFDFHIRKNGKSVTTAYGTLPPGDHKLNTRNISRTLIDVKEGDFIDLAYTVGGVMNFGFLGDNGNSYLLVEVIR